MKHNILFSLLLLAFVTPARADDNSDRSDRRGTETSGGGGAAVCRDAKRRVTFAQMEDLYEGQIRFKYVYAVNSIAPVYQVLVAIKGLPEAFDRAAVQEAVAHTISSLHFLPEGVGLAPTTDLGRAIGVVVPNGCGIEPVGYYETDGTLQVSREIYSKLDSRNRAAFILHEAVYKLARDTAGQTDSADTRRAVGSLFATNIAPTEKTALLEKVAFPFLAGRAAGEHLPFAGKVVLAHPNSKLTVVTKPDNILQYDLSIRQASMTDSYEVLVTDPRGFSGGKEISFVDRSEFSELDVDTAPNHLFFDVENVVVSFDVQDDQGHVVFHGVADSKAGIGTFGIAIARDVSVPPIPNL